MSRVFFLAARRAPGGAWMGNHIGWVPILQITCPATGLDLGMRKVFGSVNDTLPQRNIFGLEPARKHSYDGAHPG